MADTRSDSWTVGPFLVVLLSCLSGCVSCGPRPSAHLGVDPDRADYAVVRVFYATDRASLPPSAVQGYSAERSPGGKLALGMIDVSIPHDHRLGELERPSILRFEFSPDPEKHVTLLRATQLSTEAFRIALSASIAASSKHDMFVFIHGYKVSFDDAVLRTGQIAYDLGFKGAPIAYTWPSQGAFERYTVDENEVHWTVPHLRWFLEELASTSGAKTIHLIAHSMGTRALSYALQAIAAAHPDVSSLPFREVVMAAADIDADTFAAIADQVRRPAARFTLYASSHDQALAASEFVHGHTRLGSTNLGVRVIPGMDTVDASAVRTDFLGHSYIGDHLSILNDIFQLFRGTPVAERFGVDPVPTAKGVYYALRPAAHRM